MTLFLWPQRKLSQRKTESIAKTTTTLKTPSYMRRKSLRWGLPIPKDPKLNRPKRYVYKNYHLSAGSFLNKSSWVFTWEATCSFHCSSTHPKKNQNPTKIQNTSLFMVFCSWDVRLRNIPATLTYSPQSLCPMLRSARVDSIGEAEAHQTWDEEDACSRTVVLEGAMGFLDFQNICNQVFFLFYNVPALRALHLWMAISCDTQLAWSWTASRSLSVARRPSHCHLRTS